ncbi:S1C family serine protease [Polaromonas sp.]|uniref:S1C family serine protease n=1 Tax=Polaromonas sp. TaxID=1869339 RepID=UPI00286C269A|nr:S1C family serine protease [Polaromonas sp.]
MRASPLRLLVALLLSLPPAVFGPPALAATAAPLSAQATLNALNKASAAVVGVQVTAAEGARSAETLGLQRSGSGVVISADGLVLTIGYLMLEAQQIEIVTQDNKTLPAVPVAYDIATGFGLLRPLLPLRGVAPVPLGNLRDLQTGEPLMAATGATADGDDADVSMTLLVSKRAFSGSWEYHLDTAIFTSPPVSAGRGNHSGAPLFNQKGELVGIGSLLVMDALGENRRVPGNMFVPVDLLKPILAELQQSGSSRQSRRPWLGLTSNDQGGRVQIMRVSADSPAERAGLQPGEVVLAVDGAEVTTLEGFYKKLWARAAPDAPVRLTVRHGEEVRTIVLEPQDRMLTLKKPSSI